MKSVIKVILMCFISFATASAYAATINGSLLVGGVLDIGEGVTLDAANFITLSTVIGTAGTGDIGDVSGLTGTGGSAYLTGFTPVTGFMSIGGWQLDLTSLTIVDQTTSLLNLSGSGVLSGNGFEGTIASWSFSAENATVYSMTVTGSGVLVPVPAAAWLFGSGLIGLVGVARKRA